LFTAKDVSAILKKIHQGEVLRWDEWNGDTTEELLAV
jgi:hypothetical protein